MASLKTLTAIVSLFSLACFGVSPSAVASPTSGIKYGIYSVEARSVDTFYVKFRGGEQGTIVVSGDGDTDLDLFVFDEKGNLVACDTYDSDDCVAVLLPKRTGVFRIEVRNLGGVYNKYEFGCL